jgi:26S proteasome regulatory subunit N2
MLNTASTYLAFLQEEDRTIRSLALDKIEKLIDEYWAEISEHINILDRMYNDPAEEKKELVSIILSKIYYNLDDYESAIEWALKSNERFNIAERNQFVKTILKKIIDKYISIRKANFFNSDDILPIDERINSIVERIFCRCIEKGEFYQAIGMSLESYDLERVLIN